MALRLEAALGIQADFWLKIQLQRDLCSARKNPKPSVEKITA